MGDHLSNPPLSSASDMDMFPWTPADTGFSPMTPMTTTNFDLNSIDERSTIPDDDDVEEIVRRDSFASNMSAHAALVRRAQEPSPYLEFNIPFSDFTQRKNRRHLVDHFCNVLSHLIVFREENGNPFQQLVLPLSHSSPAVMDSIYALASAHLEFRGVENMEKSDYFHGRAIQELARLIEKGGGENRNELLAAIMLLVYYEVLVQKGRSNIVDGHLKGAMSIMSNRKASTDPTGVFLERVRSLESLFGTILTETRLSDSTTLLRHYRLVPFRCLLHLGEARFRPCRPWIHGAQRRPWGAWIPSSAWQLRFGPSSIASQT